MSRKPAKNRVEAGGIEPCAPMTQVPENPCSDGQEGAPDSPRRPLTVDKNGGTVPPGGLSAVAAGDAIEPGAFEAATDDEPSQEECIECRACSEAGGAERPVYHLPPECLPAAVRGPLPPGVRSGIAESMGRGPDVGTEGARVAGFDPAAGPDRSAVVVLERTGHEPETYRVAGARDWKGAPLLMVRAAAKGLLLELTQQLRPGAVILTEPPVPPERAWSAPSLPEGIPLPGAPLDGYELRIRLIDGEERHVETCWHFTCGCWLTVLELTGAIIRREPCKEHGR
jgi:hypothetical protein